MRDFSNGKKQKKGGKWRQPGSQSDAESASGTEAAGAEEEPVVAVAEKENIVAEKESFAAPAQDKKEELHLDQSLFKPFTLGDVKKI